MRFWVDASSQATIDGAYLRIARTYRIPEDVSEVRSWLSSTSESWLLVLDDVDSSLHGNINEYIPLTPEDCLVLVTSRSHHLRDHATAIELEVKEMTEEDATKLLLETVENGQTDYSSARSLAVDLGKIPLAIDLAGAYIKETKTPIKEYHEIFRTDMGRTMKRTRKASVTGYQKSIVTAWDISYREIAKDSNDGKYAIELLHFLSLLHPKDFPTQLLDQAHLNISRAKQMKTDMLDIALVKDNPTERAL